MQVHVFRHGVPVARDAENAPPDRERPLTDQGEKLTRRSAQSAAKLGVNADVVATSPLVRARQTAEIAADVLKVPPERVEVLDELEPDASPSETVEALATLETREGGILVTGHKPNLHRTASTLLSGSPQGVDVALGKASLLTLEIPELGPGVRGTLERSIPPDELRAIA
jgi:phosphohistidine phosphatase